MDTTTIRHNASDLNEELNWLAEIIDTRLRLSTGQKPRYRDIDRIKPPSLRRSKSAYAGFIAGHGLGPMERFLLILAIAPHIRPDMLDSFYGRMRDEVESTRGTASRTGPPEGSLENDADPADAPAAVRHHSGFIPTGETAVFLFAGDDLEKRFLLLKTFERSHPLTREQVLWLDDVQPGEPMLKGRLRISDAALRLFTTGEATKSVFDPDFLMAPLSTPFGPDDLVHAGQLHQPLGQIEAYLQNRESLTNQWQGGKHHHPGLKVLFYGPAGTGKTLAAALIGKKTGVDVYRIDLSAVTSKYIGETEKNLSRILERAENRNWILFFDEADALFGKRTSVADAHDRYSNADTSPASSLFLTLLENYRGLAILSLDLGDTPGKDLYRRFHLAVHFPMPGMEERLQLWKDGFGKSVRLDRHVDLKHLAATHELSGGTIMNVIRFATLHALHRKSRKVDLIDILEGIVHHKPD